MNIFVIFICAISCIAWALEGLVSLQENLEFQNALEKEEHIFKIFLSILLYMGPLGAIFDIIIIICFLIAFAFAFIWGIYEKYVLNKIFQKEREKK